MLLVPISLFHHRSGKGKLSSQSLGQLPAHFHISFRLYSPAGYHQDVFLLNGFLVFDNLGRQDPDPGLPHSIANLHIFNNTCASLHFFRPVHDTVADSGKLRAGICDQDLSHDIAAKGRTDLYHICILPDIQGCAVRSKSCMESGGKTWSQAAAQSGSPDQYRRRFLPGNTFCRRICIDICPESFKTGIFKNKYMLNPIFQENVGIFPGPFSSYDQAVHVKPHFFRHLSGFSDQFKDYRMDLSLFLLRKNEEAFPVFFILRPGFLLKAYGPLRTYFYTDAAHPAFFIYFDSFFSHVQGAERTFLYTFITERTQLRVKFQ